MRPRWHFVLIVCGAGAIVSGDLFACGDKFLVPSRGTRFSKAPAARQEANILVYVNPQAPSSAAFGKLPVETILREAGYKPTTVADASALERALAESKWDLVLADLSDGPTLRSRTSAHGAPAIVPVLVEPTSAALAEARQEYGSALKAPFRGQRLLDTVDGAIALRQASSRDARAAH